MIRQLISEDKHEILEGPWACAELFRLHHAIEQDYNFPTLVECNNGVVGYICKPRLNLLTSKQTIESKVDYILREYLSHPDREELYEEFSPLRISDTDICAVTNYYMTVKQMKSICHPG